MRTHGDTGTNSVTASTSPPPANALIVSVPPSCAMSTEFPRSAAIALPPPSMSVRSTSRPFARKMPFSFA